MLAGRVAEAIGREGRVGLAVSGGPDSLALLRLCQVAGLAVAVATVDHGLRAESADEAEEVAALCRSLGIAHQTLQVSLEPGGNLQARARAARYAALAGWAREQGLWAIATAHHRDDQAETLLMRLARGSGVAGLAGMRARATVPGAPDLTLLRPLLDVAKADLRAVVEEAGWRWCEDPSNAAERFDRVRVRQGLAQAEWLDPQALADSAALLAEADEALTWAAQREWDERVTRDERGVTYRPVAPRAIRYAVVSQIIGSLASEGQPRGKEIARLVATLEAGGTATLAGVRAGGRGDAWHFAPAPPRNS